ncbi:MAG TPA: hypothetical protein PK598_11345 [Thermoanaerobaculia bacterium]|nr:hypothetical protein [Thermoanaerobaculia bacterium]
MRKPRTKRGDGVPGGWTAAERRILAKLSTPEAIQRFLDEEIGYNHEPDGETCRSPRAVLRDRIAHCGEGSIFAAAALRFHGRPPLVIQLRAVRDTDHVLALFTVPDGRGGRSWGAVAKSNYAGLRYRSPVYRTVRDLALSYFEDYYSPSGELTLRTFTRPVDLSRFDAEGWETAEGNICGVADWIATRTFHPLLTPAQIGRLCRVDARLYRAGLHGSSGLTVPPAFRAGARPRRRSPAR